ncbi:class I SAM-dependent methyltransferase [Kitasatospora sp. NPDC048286]|uniref:class I SAM-dependent methyltransferase n=1 Tax=Kitasatospora sp. NPDC048286 TaxID=3364047 RepID=UPI0037168DD2
MTNGQESKGSQEFSGLRNFRELAGSFGAVAAEYDRGRPGYPEELFDELERFWGRGLKGARVLDVGAGTGIATRLLAARGADVVAVEPSAGMAAQFQAVSPQLPLVRGGGDDLPFHDHCADLITYAQAFHWTQPGRSVPEAVRVLRPGGALAAWWNLFDETVPWVRARDERLSAELSGRYHGYGRVADLTAPFAAAGLEVRRTQLRWQRRVSVEQVVDNLTSRSYFASLAPERREPLLAAERAALLAEFPDGQVVEPYVLDLTVAVARH